VDEFADDRRRSEESLQRRTSGVPSLASWYMIGWMVPTLIALVAGAIQWNDQQLLYAL